MTAPIDMSDFEATIRKLTTAQRHALDAIAMNQPPRSSKRALESLEKLGLIHAEKRSDQTRLGTFVWKEYHTPVPVHIAWCSVCSSEYDGMTDEERAEAEG